MILALIFSESKQGYLVIYLALKYMQISNITVMYVHFTSFFEQYHCNIDHVIKPANETLALQEALLNDVTHPNAKTNTKQ